MKARHPFKFRTCQVCQREYRVFPQKTANKRIVYRGNCGHCGAHSSKRGRIEIPEHEEQY